MPDAARAQEIRAELEKLAPYPANGDVTARGLARWMAMESQLAWARMTGMDHPITMTDVAILQGNFAAAHALLALATAEPADADAVAGEIREAFDPPGIGEWLYEHLGDDAEQIAALAEELAKATVADARVVVSQADLRVLMRLAEGYASRDPLRLPPNDSCREALDRLAAAVKP
jgi:hypothetical protein